MGQRRYPEAAGRAEIAFETAKTRPEGKVATSVKKALLRAQYSGTRALFESDPDAIAVAWNGLNGTRRVFMDAARDAGARRLFFELAPFPGRITVDPCGVNFRNGLPRTPAPYLAWAEERGPTDAWRDLGRSISARQPASAVAEQAPEVSLDNPFVFVPLQVQGDSQLRLFGGAFRTVERVIEAVAEAARGLPDGWHARIKEHPTSPVRFADLIQNLGHDKLVLDNATDTFEQVEASRCVVTVNSSVGLEAMFFEKPVVALGDCFWAIPGIAAHCPTPEALSEALATPERLGFDPVQRTAFLNYLAEVYYPDLRSGDGSLDPREATKVAERLMGPDRLGFWTCVEDNV